MRSWKSLDGSVVFMARNLILIDIFSDGILVAEDRLIPSTYRVLNTLKLVCFHNFSF